jgi:ectoine hydroxylase-related dioxygenase (phytanoyl-CoA dioxygenase family)
VRTMSSTEIDELRRALDQEGYAVMRSVVPEAEVQSFDEAIRAEYSTAEKFRGGGSFSGHLNCFPGEMSRFFLDAIGEAGIVDAVHALRPNSSNAVRATLNFNLPGSVAQHYHMDGLYTEDFLICNVAVVDTDLVNGAIDLLPGTNRRFYTFWQYALQRKYRSTTRIPMKRGDVLIRTSTLWHRGMPNKSSTPRPMMSMTFGEKSAPDGDPFAVHDGKLFFYPNWFKTSRLGQIRERTFVVAPLTYSAYRFVKSLRGKRGFSSY